MSDPIVDPQDLGTYLEVDDINTARAALLIELAQAKCESVCSPLPAAARGVVLEVAARAYSNASSAHNVSLGSANIGFGAQQTSAAIGGLYLSRTNERELRRLAGRTGAFTVDVMPVTAGYLLPPWDFDSGTIL